MVKKEKFLILEILSDKTNGLFLTVNEDRTITLEKFVPNANLKKLLTSPLRRMTHKSWEGNYLFKRGRRKIIAAADSNIATTIPIPLDIPRERADAKYEISLAELENLIAQAMGKIFNQCRSEAAKRLHIHELDTILVGAKARNFKIDEKSVINPEGFTGKKISLVLELRFTTRSMFEELKPFFNAPDEFFFAEGPQVRLFSIARTRALPLNLIVAEEGGASVYILQEAKDGHPVMYREKFGWDFHELIRAIGNALHVSVDMAEHLYTQYRAGAMSESAARAFKKILDPAAQKFFDALEKGKIQGFVYIDAEHELPFDMPHRVHGTVVENIPLEEILQELDFPAAPANGSIPSRILARHLLPFFEAYFDKSNSDINQKLRRRLHWLLT
jgi:hypothetical protein